MTRQLIIAGLMATLIILAGCSESIQGSASSGIKITETPNVETSMSESVKRIENPFSDKDWSDNGLSKVPQPLFSVAPFEVAVDTGLVEAKYKNVPDSEISQYANMLKDAGLARRSNEELGQKGSNDYYFYEPGQSTIGITVSISRKYDGSIELSVANPAYMASEKISADRINGSPGMDVNFEGYESREREEDAQD